MQDYYVCPNCERMITLQQMEAPCQLCGRDMCSHCMRKCPDCGKEVCDEDWIRGKCVMCDRKSWVSAGYETIKTSEGAGGKAIGAGLMAAGAFETVRQHEKLKEARERREMGDEAYDKRENLEAVRLGVSFVIIFIIFGILMLSGLFNKHLSSGTEVSAGIFLIVGFIFALWAGFYVKEWVENRYY